jgi:membrane protease YdiL (CAAX protease family)
VIASAVMFALLHPPISVIPVFVLGVVTAICFARTRWLLPAVVAHFVYNAIVFIVG